MSQEALFDRIRALLGEEGLEFQEDLPQPGVVVKADRLLEFANVLRDDPELAFESLQQMAGVDWPEEKRIRCSTTVWSFSRDRLLTFHVDLSRDNPRLPSLCGIWPAADWHERECWDLSGIIFEGHPDLRRIMLPDDWEGHPLRKDFEEKAEYNGIPTQREREWLSWQK
ncbi:MAG: NADH-quinone oxidoreductase subunit C [bacterium]|nr:NADH-quinone oxidoreductase subunit C [bacterium]